MCGFWDQQRDKGPSFGNKAFNQKEDVLVDCEHNFEGQKKSLKHIESQFPGIRECNKLIYKVENKISWPRRNLIRCGKFVCLRICSSLVKRSTSLLNTQEQEDIFSTTKHCFITSGNNLGLMSEDRRKL